MGTPEREAGAAPERQLAAAVPGAATLPQPAQLTQPRRWGRSLETPGALLRSSVSSSFFVAPVYLFLSAGISAPSVIALLYLSISVLLCILSVSVCLSLFLSLLCPFL